MQTSTGQQNPEEDEFEEVDEELRREIIQNPDAFSRVLDRPEIQEIIISHEAFQGPLPHPRILRDYEAVLPGAADRIFKLTEDEFKHRHDMEDKALNGAIFRDKRGQNYGLSATIFTVLCALILGLTGHDFLAGAVIGTVVAIATIFVLRNKPKNKPQKKDEDKAP
ncbi:UNVERIFIED_ORG: putative membrane protein [Rahnella aquatilis]|uniref:DUF2335 domain-containing protein n=1 Tax=Rahnella sp. NRRL B-41462 TaxID=1610579 RepID=UPI000DD4D40A|nr:DUF2335 domain-containing protein [Rahnella sp. NRRL B-41462]